MNKLHSGFPMHRCSFAVRHAVLLAVLLFDGQVFSDDTGQAPKQRPTDASNVVRMSVEQYYKMLRSDGQRDLKAYAGRTVELTGHLVDVSVTYPGADGDGMLWFTLAPTATSTKLVDCLMKPGEWKKSSPRRQTTIRAQVVLGLSRRYLLVHGTVFKAEGEPPPVVTAKQLTAEYLADAQAFREKYEEKFVAMSGTVASSGLDATWDAYSIHTLVKGMGNSSVALHYSKGQFKKIKSGERVTVFGQLVVGSDKNFVNTPITVTFCSRVDLLPGKAKEVPQSPGVRVQTK